METKAKKILLLGSGMMSGAVIEYLRRRPQNHITVASNILKDAEELIKNHPDCKAVFLDIMNEGALKELIRGHDIVISMIPAVLQGHLAKPCLDEKKNLVTSSYTKPEMRALEKEVEEAGLLFLNECGLDPGIDHMTAKKVIDEAIQDGGKILEFTSYCGGLVAPDDCDNPFGYKFSWSPIGALRSLKNFAKYYKNGEIKEVDKDDLLFTTETTEVNPAVTLEVYPNRDSLVYKDLYKLADAETVIRGTFRFQGFPLLMRSMSAIGLLDEKPVDEAHKADKWKAFITKLVGSEDGANPKFVSKEHIRQVIQTADIAENNTELVTKISNRILDSKFYKEKSQDELSNMLLKVVRTMKWLNLFDDNMALAPKATYVECFCSLLEPRIMLKENEKDFIVMQHKFRIQGKDGKTKTVKSNFLKIGEKNKTAMSVCVGYTAATTAQLVLDGKINKKGVHIPITPDIYNPILSELAKDGLFAREEVE